MFLSRQDWRFGRVWTPHNEPYRKKNSLPTPHEKQVATIKERWWSTRVKPQYREAATEEEVKANWEKIKLKEKGEARQSVLQGVPSGLPSLVKAQRIQEKVRGVGFDWDHAGQVWDKVQEELGELQDEVERKSDRVADEFGDVLFALINYARFLDVNPDEALERTNRRFKARFEAMERRIEEAGLDLAEMPLEEMDRHWDAAKAELGQ